MSSTISNHKRDVLPVGCGEVAQQQESRQRLECRPRARMNGLFHVYLVETGLLASVYGVHRLPYFVPADLNMFHALPSGACEKSR
jgi:hypothetical protein